MTETKPTVYLEFLGRSTPLNQEEAEAFQRLWKRDSAKVYAFRPVRKAHYCKSEGRLGCDCLPCACPEDFLQKQKHLSWPARIVNQIRAEVANWLEMAARRVR